MPINDPSRAALIALARTIAAEHLLDAALVCAICEQESSWNPWAMRFEPAFFARYIAPMLNANVPGNANLPIGGQKNAPEGNHAPAKLCPTEAYARAFSWGLMQVMGQVAREHGFGAPPSPTNASPSNFALPSTNASLAQLCDPSTGLEFGCRVLATKLSAAQGDVPRALQLWNGGSNAGYAAEVIARAGQYK